MRPTDTTAFLFFFFIFNFLSFRQTSLKRSKVIVNSTRTSTTRKFISDFKNYAARHFPQEPCDKENLATQTWPKCFMTDPII